MYCSKCGSQISDDAVICIHCGVQVKPNGSAQRSGSTVDTSNPLALVGFILSFFFNIPALICSAIAYRRCKDDPNLEGKGFALAGVIISAIKLGCEVLLLLIYVCLLGALLGSIGRYGM